MGHELCACKGDRSDLPIVWVILLAEMCGEIECWQLRFSQPYRLTGRRCYEQSTNPFHADIEALRAVSTVPPMTTNFWETVSLSCWGGEQDIAHQCILDRGSVEAEWCQEAPKGVHSHAGVTGRVVGGVKYTLKQARDFYSEHRAERHLPACWPCDQCTGGWW